MAWRFRSPPRWARCSRTSTRSHLTTGDVGLLGSVYLFGEVVGALVFGRITDMIGRKKMFVACLGLYLVASGLGGFSFNLWSLLACRFLAGMGIGGEYTAINSAIDELIPSHYRGRVDIAVNGTYWAGAMIGAAVVDLPARPASPAGQRWLAHRVLHRPDRRPGHHLSASNHPGKSALADDARPRRGSGDASSTRSRSAFEREGVHLEPVPDSKAMEIRPTGSVSYIQIAQTMLGQYPSRSFLGFSMMVTQAFLYNAIFFTYALVLQHFYNIPSDRIGVYFFPFAAGNLVGPLLLGHLFDTVGRRKMILLTYGGSGILLAISAVLFHAGVLERRDADRVLVRDLLLCLGGRLVGVPDGQRDLPAGAAGSGDLLLLRHLPAGRRRGCAVGSSLL